MTLAPVADFLLGLDLVRHALAAGETGRPVAAGVAAALDTLAARMSTPTAVAIATVVRGIVDDDAGTLLDSLELVRRSPSPLLAGRAAEDAGLALLASGHAAEARAFFDEAQARARCSTRLRRSRGSNACASAPARRGPASSRSSRRRRSSRAAEQTVLSLVGEGLDNGQIAEHLAISKRTVESHLAKLYAKLDVKGRVALGNEARRRGRNE